jgi:hypothetical protein
MRAAINKVCDRLELQRVRGVEAERDCCDDLSYRRH